MPALIGRLHSDLRTFDAVPLTCGEPVAVVLAELCRLWTNVFDRDPKAMTTALLASSWVELTAEPSPRRKAAVPLIGYRGAAGDTARIRGNVEKDDPGKYTIAYLITDAGLVRDYRAERRWWRYTSHCRLDLLSGGTPA